MSDWADEKARDWLHQKSCAEGHIYNASPADGSGHAHFDELIGGGVAASLADLLREVAEDKSFVGAWGYLDKHKYLDKAEVRRVVKDVRDSQRPPGVPLNGRDTCLEILDRLEKL